MLCVLELELTPQIRSHDFWRYINLYVCVMYMYKLHSYLLTYFYVMLVLNALQQSQSFLHCSKVVSVRRLLICTLCYLMFGQSAQDRTFLKLLLPFQLDAPPGVVRVLSRAFFHHFALICFYLIIKTSATYSRDYFQEHIEERANVKLLKWRWLWWLMLFSGRNCDFCIADCVGESEPVSESESITPCASPRSVTEPTQGLSGRRTVLFLLLVIVHSLDISCSCCRGISFSNLKV